MASTNDNGENFKWTNEYVTAFCEICIKYIRKHGRGLLKWREIKDDFEATAKRKITHSSLKNKWDAMKKDWIIWKNLKRDETGLGWDRSTNKLNCSNEWWDRKIKEKPEVKNSVISSSGGIRKNSVDDMMFNVLEQHPDYIPPDELQDFGSAVPGNKNLSEISSEMKEIRNNIATLLWDARP